MHAAQVRHFSYFAGHLPLLIGHCNDQWPVICQLDKLWPLNICCNYLLCIKLINAIFFTLQVIYPFWLVIVMTNDRSYASLVQKFMRRPGIEPRANAWKAFMLPLHHRRNQKCLYCDPQNSLNDCRGHYAYDPCGQLRQPWIEHGAQRWQRWILPLNHWREEEILEIFTF